MANYAEEHNTHSRAQEEHEAHIGIPGYLGVFAILVVGTILTYFARIELTCARRLTSDFKSAVVAVSSFGKTGVFIGLLTLIQPPANKITNNNGIKIRGLL